MVPAGVVKGAGSSSVQTAMAYGQRVWKRQPLGGSRGLGISPPRTMRVRPTLGAGLGARDG